MSATRFSNRPFSMFTFCRSICACAKNWRQNIHCLHFPSKTAQKRIQNKIENIYKYISQYIKKIFLPCQMPTELWIVPTENPLNLIYNFTEFHQRKMEKDENCDWI